MSTDKLKTLRDRRGKLVAEMKSIIEAAAEEKRDLTPEEASKHEGLFDQVEKLRQEIQAQERQVELEREEAAASEGAERAERAVARGDAAEARALWDRTVEAAPSYLRDHLSALDPVAEIRMAAAFRSYLKSGRMSGEGAEEIQRRSLEAQTDPEGGFLVVPQQFVAQLIKFVDDMLFVRQNATVIPVPSAESLGVPSLDADPADADWTVELGTGSEDSSMKFGKRELRPHPFAKRLKVSQTLIRKSALPVDALITSRLGYKVGVTEEKAFMTGSGSQQPLGVFTASNDGIGTARDVSTGNTATEIRTDGLIEAKYTLKPQYWPRARWTFHRDAVKQLAKLKDGEGRYLWQPSIQVGQPDRILNLPFDMSEFAPNTFTTGLYVGLLGDWSNYWIADALSLQMQRLTELYAETNQVGFISRQETDGMPVLAEAFVRVKLA